MKTISIKLSNSADSAVVDQKTLCALHEAGVSMSWFLNSDGSGNSYVRVAQKGKPVAVSRLITKAAKGSLVQFKDGNKLNLCASNLRIIHRGGKSTNI